MFSVFNNQLTKLLIIYPSVLGSWYEPPGAIIVNLDIPIVSLILTVTFWKSYYFTGVHKGLRKVK